MNKIPTFGLGDAVRVMQTEDMVWAGFANMTGIIVGGDMSDGVQEFQVRLDNVDGEQTEYLPASVLMHKVN